jgi:hypothetical protein
MKKYKKNNGLTVLKTTVHRWDDGAWLNVPLSVRPLVIAEGLRLQLQCISTVGTVNPSICNQHLQDLDHPNAQLNVT